MQRTKNAGFTLVEMLVVMAIVAVVAAIAYPSYGEHLVRTRRGAAAGCLFEISQQLERRYTTNLTYTSNGTDVTLPVLSCTADNARFYAIRVEPAPTSTTTTYVVTAAPAGAQVKDTACGTLTLNQQGVKGVSGTKPVADCWK